MNVRTTIGAHMSVKLMTLSACVGLNSTIPCSSKRFLYTVDKQQQEATLFNYSHLLVTTTFLS